jgi:uncharacterized OB-fold protein
MAAYEKPLPVPDADTAAFWDACRKHELRAQKCLGCGAFRWPPQGMCPACRGWDFEWTLLPGTGRVHSFVAPHYVAVKAFAADVPYVIAQVELDGTRGKAIITSNVIGCPWTDVAVGMPVKVVFDDVTPDCTLPKFRPLR